MTNSRFTFGEGSLLNSTKSRSFVRFMLTLVFVMSAFLTQVFGAISVSSQPQTNNDFCGSGAPSLTLPVVATSGCGSGTIGYKWYVGSVTPGNQITSSGSPNYSGWTTSTLIVGTAASLGTNTVYYAVLNETSGACSDIDTIGPFNYTKVSTTPTLTFNTNPFDVCQNTTVTYTATVTGPSPAGNLTYNWFRKGHGGAFSNTQTTSTTSTSNSYSYYGGATRDNDSVYATVSNSCGSTQTATVGLQLNPKPNVVVPSGMSSITACEGAGFVVTYNIDTAVYQNRGGNVNWTLNPTGGSSAALSSLLTLNGNGNLNYNSGTIGAALAPGVYSVTFASATNTTDGCTRTIATNTINVTIYPKPTITFSATPSDYCRETGSTSFSITVANAQYNNGASPVNVNWSATITENSKNVSGSCTSGSAGVLSTTITGSGNGTFVYNPSSTLSPGDYSYTLTGITNTSNSCVGSVTGTSAVSWSVRPRPSINVVPTSTSVCEGNSTNFNIFVTNAQYCVGAAVTGATWSLSHTDNTNSNIPATPLTGSGNGTSGPYTTDATLTPGTYVFTPGTITNTVGGHGGCARVITGNTFTLTVNPTPSVTFSTSSIKQCQGTVGTTFTMTVSNAELNAVGQNWSVNYTAAGGNALSGTPCSAGSSANIITGGQSGTGNTVRQFTIPSNLSPGYYTYTLNSVTNTSSSCVTTPASNSVGANGTITIIIDPRPVITMNPDSKDVCENDGESVNIQITNTKGCSAIGASYDADWTFQGVTDNVQSDIATVYGTYPTGTGNSSTNVSVNTATTLTPDNHSLIASIYNVTAATSCAVANKTTDTFTLIVNPRPEVKINNTSGASQSIDVCQGTAGAFSFDVSNAKQNGVDQNWEITYAESSGNLTTTCNNTSGANQDLPGGSGVYSGSGDGTFNVTVPATLPVGRYTYTVSNIVNTDGPCTGTVDGVQLGTQTIVINVYPKPNVAITPGTAAVCETEVGTNALKLVVTNAEYCSAPNTKSNVSYNIFYGTDQVQSTVGGSPFAGAGNATHSFDVNNPATLTQGTYRFITSSLATTGLSTNCSSTQIDTLVLTVNPEPVATFTTASIDVCEGTVGTVNMEITNAVLNGNNVNWEVTVSESSGNVGTSCITAGGANAAIVGSTFTGSGNKVGGGALAFNTSTSLPPGRYTYTITQVENTDAGCVGTVAPTSTIVVNVYPKPKLTIVPDSAELCENSAGSNIFSINVTNARYCPAANTISNVSYDITYGTDNVVSNVGGSPFSGVGNTNYPFDANVGAGLTEGYYKFITASLATTGLSTNCSSAQVDTFVLQMNPEPVATFTAASIDVCQGTTGTVEIEVSNATLNGVGVNWQIDVTENSGNVNNTCTNGAASNASFVGATVTGNGNKSGGALTFTVPTTAIPGRYTYTLTQIENTDGSCVGTIGATATIVVNVLPKPALTITPASDEVCENSVLNNAFSIVVTNAAYCSAANTSSAVDYDITYTDAVASNIVGVPYANSGNGTFTFNANNAASLAAGTYRFITGTLTTTNLTTNCSSSQIDTFVLTVNPEPIASFDVSPVNVCEGETGQVQINVSNAMLNGAGVNWTMTTTESSGNIPTSCQAVSGANASIVPASISGNGDSTIVYTVPSTLSPGVYTYTINAITNTDKSCNGSVTPIGTVFVRVYPKIAVSLSTNAGAVCQGDQTQFVITTTNSKYCTNLNVAATNADWDLDFTDATNSNAFANPLSGSGNSTITITTNNATTLPAGIYDFVMDSITITSGGLPGCVNVLTSNNTYTLTVNPEPEVTFNASNINICEGSTGSFNVVVSNATLAGNGVAWTVDVTGDSTTVANACASGGAGAAIMSVSGTNNISGSGDSTVVFNIPGTLAPGVYTYTLNGIVNTTPPCTGVVGGIPTITIVVYPKPNVVVSIDSLTVCENTTATVDISVTNARYCASIGGATIPVGWEITHTDATNSNIPASIWVGSDNMSATTYTVNNGFALTAGTYNFDVQQIENTTHGCVNTDFTGNELVVTVDDLPTLTINNVTSDTCRDNNARIDWTVSDVGPNESWTFDINANSTTHTITGTGDSTGVQYTTNYTTIGIKTITYSNITNTTTGCISNVPHANSSVNILALPDITSFAPTSGAAICAGLDNDYDFVVSNSAGKDWTVTYNIDGGSNLTWSGTGNGSFTRSIPVQYHTSATGAASTRTITITNIVWTGTVPACGNSTLTASTATVVVNPRPSIDLVSPTNTCVNYTADINYTVTGVAATDVWEYDWYTTGPTNGPNTETNSGANNTGTFTTQPLTPVGYSTVYVPLITNTTTGCDSTHSSWYDSIQIDPPTVPGTLSPSYTICDGEVGPYVFTLSGYTGTIQRWDSSENGGYLWMDIGHADSTTHTVVNPHLTTNYQVVVKSGACPADTSNDVVLFVHPQPASTIVSLTDSICTGSNINMVYDVTGVPNTHNWTIDYTVKIGAGAPSAATITGTGSGAAKTLTLTNGGSGFASGPVVVTFTKITNNNTGCDSTLTSTKTTKVKSAPNGSTASTNQTLCQNSNGFVKWDGTAADGYVVGWQKKVGSGSWSTMAGTANDTLEFTGLTTTTMYRAVVENAPCSGQAFSSATTITIIATNPTAEFYNLPASNKNCASATGTTSLQYEVSGTNGNDWALTIREGDSLHTVTGTGDKTGASALTFTTSSGRMLSTFNVTLIKLVITSGSTTCTKNLDNTAMAVITVIDLPTASINSVTSPVCSGSNITASFNVSNVKSSESWSLAYTVNGSAMTLTGTGPGNFSASHAVTGTNGTQNVVLTSITNTTTKNSSGSNCVNTISGQSTSYVVRGATSPGTIGTSTSVCKGASGFVSQSSGSSNGATITDWVSSTWNGSAWTSWTSTGNTSTTQAYVGLNNTTRYRAIYANSPCDTAGSNTVTITVQELPIATISLTSGNDTICEGGTATVTVTTTNMNAGQNFTLNYTEGSVTKSKNLVNSGTITFTTGVITSTTDITLSSVSTTSGTPQCSNTSLNSTVTVTVQEKPTGTIASFDNDLCHGSTVNYTLTIGNVGSTDKWTAALTLDGASETLTGTGTGTFSGTTTNIVTSTSDILKLVSVTNNSTQDACATTINQSKTITVKSTTVAGTIGTSTSVCKGSSGSITQSTSGTGSISYWLTRAHNGTSWGTWSSIGNTATTQTYTNLQNTTQYKAVYKNDPCDTASSNTVTITVLELPIATLSLTSGNDTICEGATSTVTVTVDNIATGQDFRIDYTEGSSTKFKTFTKTASSTYTFTTGTISSTTVIALDKIQTTSGVACENTALNSSVTVTVQEKPTATIASADNVLCHGETVDYSVTVGNMGSTDSWTLNLNLDGSSETVTGKGTGTFSFSTTATVTSTSDILTLDLITNNSTQDACKTTLTDYASITVDTTTVPGIIGTSAIAGDTTICRGSSAQLLEYASGTGNITKWQSRVKSSSTWVDINSTGTAQNVYNVNDTTFYRAVYQNGVCSSNVSNQIAVNPKKLPLVVISNVIDDSICAGTTADFEITVSNVDAGQNFTVYYKEGSVSNSASLTQTASGKHTISTGTLTSSTLIQLTSVNVTSGHPQCSDTLSSNGTVTVLSLPFATITAGPDTLCQGDKVVFTVNISNVSSSDNWALTYELESNIDTIYGTGPGSYTTVDTDPNTAESAKIQLIEILNLSNLGICKSANTDDWDIYIFKPTEPGTIGYNDTICKGSSTSIAEIVGTPKQGVTVSWEYKPSSASNWTALSNSNTTLNIINLQETTSYRAIYKSGVCDTAHSNVITIVVRELPLATISGSTTICAGDSTDLTVTVTNVGATQDWEIEYLVGTQIAYMNGTGGGNHTLRVGNFVTTSDVTLREISTITGIPTCTNSKLTNNAKATVNVNPRPYASLNSVNTPVCQNSTSTFNVTVGNVKSGDSWTLTYNVDDAVFGSTVSGTGPGTVTVSTPSLVTAKTYNVELLYIKNNTTTCDSNLSSTMGIVVDATTQAGSVASDTTVCYADHVGTVTHVGGNGSIKRWEVSQDNGVSWATITNTASTYTYNNLTSTSKFRVVKQNGNICAEASTAPITVTVNALPVASVAGSDTICATNSGTLTVNATNTQGEDWMVSYLVGTRLDTISVSGPLTSATINTGTLSKTTDVTLKKIWMTSGAPKCQNDNLTNNATGTVEVNDLPAATLISLTDSVCTGTPAYGKSTISNVRSYEKWKLYWSINGGSADSVSGTGAGSFNFTTKNLTANPSTIRLVRIVNIGTGCSYIPTDEDSVVVSPITIGGTLSGADTVCKGSNSGTVSLGADARGNILGWEYSTDNGSTWTAISSTASTYTYNNLTTTTWFRVSVKNGACDQKYSSNVKITVNELPIAAITKVGASNICEGSSTYVVLNISNVASGLNWDLKYLQGSSVKTLSGTGSGTDTIFTGNLNTTTDITIQTLKITSGSPRCENLNISNNYTTTITVIDNPIASIISYPSNICKGETPTITVMVGDVKSGESWTLLYRINNGSNRTSTGVGSGKFDLSNVPSFTKEGPNGVRLVSITNTTASPNCTGQLSDSVTITVDSLSLGGTISGISKVCKGSNGSIYLNGRRGDVVKWQSSTDGINYYDIANTADTLNFAALSVKTWFRAVVMNGTCAATTSSVKIVDVQELPEVTITNPTQTICSGSKVSLNLSVSNTVSSDVWTVNYKENGTAGSYSVGTGSSKSITFGAYTTTTTIEFTDIIITTGLGCSNKISEKAVITVTPNPTATIASVPDSLCEDDVLAYSITVDNVNTGAAWELDYEVDGVAAATKKGNGPGTFTVNTGRKVAPNSTIIKLVNVKLGSALGCATTLSQTATIKVSPKSVGGTLSPSASTICEGANVTLTLSGETGAIVHWEFSTDGGKTWNITSTRLRTLQVTGLSTTTIYRVFVKSGSCGGVYSSTSKITVIPTPYATVTSSAIVCPREDAVFTIHVTNVGPTEGWSLVYYRDGKAQTPVTGVGSGSFDIKVVGLDFYVTNPTYMTVALSDITNTTYGCQNPTLTSSAKARVKPNPVASFDVADNCADSTIAFSSTSSIPEGSISTYKWYFGDGDSSVNGNATHQYSTRGTYAAKLVVTSDNGCIGIANKTVNVFANPVANFSSNNICENVTYSPKDLSSVTGSTIAMWLWNFGDGATSSVQNPNHEYNAAGNYSVSLKVRSSQGCETTLKKDITVYTLPEATFVAAPVCENTAMNFVNTSAIGYGTMNYNWNFSQGTSNLKDPNFTFNGFGSFNVQLIAISNNNCRDTISRTVTVHPEPIANFTVNPTCIGDVSTFVNTSTVATGTINEYYWDFADVTFSGLKNPNHTYDNPGTYNVNLRAKSDKGCVDDVVVPAEVLALPSVNLTANGATKFCDGDSVILSGNVNARTYQWTWPGGSSTNATIAAKTTGWYTLRITAPPIGCSNVDSIFITVWSSPDAKAWPRNKITQNADTISKGQSIELHASGGVDYTWNPINNLNPTTGADVIAERVLETTKYTVTVRDINGCIGTADVNIVVLDNFELIVYNAVTPNGDGMNDTWIIENIWAYPKAEVIIFNRYGMEIYRTTGYRNEWNAKYDGKDVPDGPYYYVVVNPDFPDTVYKGVINVIRER